MKSGRDGRIVLSGPKVLLAPVAAEDLPTLYRWINDRDVVISSASYQPVHFSDHEAWWEAVSHDRGTVLFAIREIGSDGLVGTCQLVGIDSPHRSAELRIRIGAPADRGRGYGTEAVTLLLRHAFADLDLHRVTLDVFATNAPAIAVYERCGFVREGVLREAVYLNGRREDIVVMGILRDEWEAHGG
jgi:RimJ/RimL family protein N-acetyltransferase